VPRLTLALALITSALAAAGAARAGDGVGGGEVHAEVRLHLRATALDDVPSTQVLYDPSARTFDLDPYLATAGSERYGSTIVAAALEGRHLDGALRWRLAADTGELRRVRSPALAGICAAPLTGSPTGLSNAAAGPCLAAGRYTLETTRPGAEELTANGRRFADELRATGLLREAWLAYSFGRAGFATVRIGRTRTIVGDGLIHDDYATGLDLALDLGALGPPFELRTAIFQPTRDFAGSLDGISPMALVRADWTPSLFEHVGLFAAARHDRTGGVANLFRGATIEDAVVRLAGLPEGTTAYAVAARHLAASLSAPLGSTASLAWLGTSGSLTPWRGQRLAWTAALLRGHLDSITVAGTDVATDVPLAGAAVRIGWTTSPLDWLSVEPWLLYLSGDRPPPEKRRLGITAGYDGFLGVTPYVTATNLFFGGGLSESFADRQASAPGVNGRGVIAPGLTATVDLGDVVDLTLRGAWLRAEDAGPFQGRTYGTEVDVTVTWTPWPWLTVGLEQDVLAPGDFFAGGRNITKTVLAVDVATP
jgi:hypothetical protein